MRKVFISAGHSDGKGISKDRGASGNGYFEGDLTIELRDLIVEELRLLGVSAITDVNSNALSQTLSWLRGKFSSKDILIDIHWNASALNTANGTEIILPEVSSTFERSLGQSILNDLASFGFKSRGLRKESETARKTLAWMRPNAENILIEVCFISNLTDMKLYQSNKKGIARKIANTIKNNL